MPGLCFEILVREGMPCSVSMAIHVDSSELYLAYVLLDQNTQVSVAVV